MRHGIWVRTAVLAICCGPLVLLLWRLASGNLGANPIEAVLRFAGDWTLRFLLITLSITPLQHLTGWKLLGRSRRTFGMACFFYGCFHFLAYAGLDKLFLFEEIARDVTRRPFITAGLASFLLLISLAVTSARGVQRFLNGKTLRLIQRLVYVSALGGVIHYLLLVKVDRTGPVIYGSILLVLLAYRVALRIGKKNRKEKDTA